MQQAELIRLVEENDEAREALLRLTLGLPDHPEWWFGPCACPDCSEDEES